jgi:4-carboxymuconolactone decarboxylase
MTAEQLQVHDTIVNGPRRLIRGPLRAALHNAELADKWQQLGELLRYRTTVQPRLSELAILIVARHWDSQFEWHAHQPIAIEAGLSAAVVEALRQGLHPDFAQPDEAIVYEYVTELLTRHHVRNAAYGRALALLQTVGIVELTALIGYYSMVALTLNAHEIPLPQDVEPPLPALSQSAS